MEKYNQNKIWDEIAISYHRVSNISKAHLDKFEQVTTLVLNLKPQRILDLGCGSGVLEKKLIEKGFDGEIVAVDNSRKMLEIAQNFLKNTKNIDFKLLDLDDTLPFKEKSFDCAVAINIMYLLKDCKQFFLEIKRILKKHSYFILVSPKPEGNIKEFFKEYFKYNLSQKSIKKVFSDALNLPYIIKIIITQKKLNNLFKKGIIHYHTSEEIQKISKLTGFKVKLVKDIQAKQNLLFLLRN